MRSLLRCETPSLSVTVLDNSSRDSEDMKELSAFAQEQNIPIIQSGLDTHPSHVNTHGEILREFVLSHTDCTHYLFVDPDVYFMKDDTITVMLRELEADPSAFGIMPRCTWDGDNDHSMPTGNAGTGESCTMRYSMRWPNGLETPEAECDAVLGERLHPFCALIKNTPEFRSVVKEVGLSNAWVFARKSGLHWDSLGLMTAVMKTHGLHYLMSSAMVFHFFNVSYDEQWIESKRQKCRAFLRELTGMPRDE